MDQPSDRDKSSTFSTVTLVACNIALVIVAIVGLIVGQCNTRDQLTLTKAYQELQFRPYILAEPSDLSFESFYRLGKDDKGDTLVMSMDSVRVGDPAYLSVQALGFNSYGSAKLINCGTTPARIERVVLSAITKREWDEVYHRSTGKIIDLMNKNRQMDSVLSDMVIAQGDTLLQADMIGIGRRMLIAEFEEIRKKKGSFEFLLYLYVEYEDLGENPYNTLRIAPYKCELTEANGVVSMSLPISAGPEKYEMDIGIELKSR